MSITSKQFYDAMGKIRADLPHKVRRFLATVATLGVEADFQGALNLRLERPAGPPINLGVIERNGQIWTETVNAHAPRNIAHRYIQELASAFSMQVEKEAFKGAWQVRDNDRAPRIEDVADKLDLWISVIEHFIVSIKKKKTPAGRTRLANRARSSTR
jgi:hypothetical protein